MAVLRCRGCGGLNNYGGVRPGKVARCGVCRVALEVSGKSQGVRVEELDRTVEGSPVPVIALVWDPADPTCRTAAATLERVSVQNLGSFLALSVDVEVHPDFAPARGVESLPTFLLFRGQQEVGRRSGVLAEGALARWLLDGLAPAGVH